MNEDDEEQRPLLWHQRNHMRWANEIAIASDYLLEATHEIDQDGMAAIRGRYLLRSTHGYLREKVDLRIRYPSQFPKRNVAPDFLLESHRDRWKNIGDSHIEHDWRLCLFVPLESGIDFANKDSLKEMFAVAHVFLTKQWMFQRALARFEVGTGPSPDWPGPERSHGIEGIAEAIAENGGVGRNSPCPCGSGQKFKRCCRDLLTK